MAALSGCGDRSGGGTDESTPTATDTTASATRTAGDPAADASTSADGPTPASAEVEFDASLAESAEECGLTCRRMSYSITNRGAGTAEDVMVGVSVSTGGEQVYETTQSVGDIGARDRRTGITADVDPGLGGGRKIRDNDGRVTVVLVPRAAGGVGTAVGFERRTDT